MDDGGTSRNENLHAAFEREARGTFREALAAYGVHSCGVDVLPEKRDVGVTITHDGRGAPLVTYANGQENERFLISASDETDLVVLCWAELEGETDLVGLGVDVVPIDDFSGDRGTRLRKLLFTERDREVVERAWTEELEEGYAFAFSAKEAAFKACAAPLRAWYATHDEELSFDLRGFELDSERRATGTARRGEAQRAMDAMGITRIELRTLTFESYVLTFAFALR